VDGPGDSRIRIFVGGLGYSRMARDIREFDRFAYGLEHIFLSVIGVPSFHSSFLPPSAFG
jgi:hypothetical protein